MTVLEWKLRIITNKLVNRLEKTPSDSAGNQGEQPHGRTPVLLSGLRKNPDLSLTSSERKQEMTL